MSRDDEKIGEEYFDVVVVGSGMFGTSAAKHIKASNPSLRVLLLGPWNEDRCRSDFFSSHDDVSRLYRHQAGASDASVAESSPLRPADLDRLTSSQFWSAVSSSSVRRFDDIASSSSIHFHKPVGFLAVGSTKSPYMTGLLKSARSTTQSPHDQPAYVHTSLETFHDSFPYVLSSPSSESDPDKAADNPKSTIPTHEFAAVHLPTNAGFLNPNKLISAQRRIFTQLGGQTLDSVLCTSITQAGDAVIVAHRPVKDEPGAKHKTVRCGQALLAAGAFSQTVSVSSMLLESASDVEQQQQQQQHPALLPPPLGLFPKTQVIALFEVSELDATVTLKGMPTMVYAGPTKGLSAVSDDTGEEISLEEELDSAYVLPPIFYEDEQKWYLKIGHGKKLERDLPAEDLPSLSSWYSSRASTPSLVPSASSSSSDDDDPPALALTSLFRLLFPRLVPLSVRIVNAGLTADTRDGKPRIYMAEGGLDRVAFCTGGNGYGAKACDEIGRIAAELFR
jgi:hypothetical protein